MSGLDARLRVEELLLTVRALDVKLSLVAEYAREPWPGYFAHIGVQGEHPMMTPPPQRRHLAIVK
jgi:hypothetical protein